MPESDDASRSDATNGDSNNPPPAETWEAVARDVLARELDDRRYALDGAFRDLGRALDDGNAVTVDDVREAREAIRQAERVLEENIVPLVDETDPWDGATKFMSNGEVARERGWYERLYGEESD
jgi:chloramphenicol 3-O-phosphotransferase